MNNLTTLKRMIENHIRTIRLLEGCNGNVFVTEFSDGQIKGLEMVLEMIKGLEETHEVPKSE